MKKLLLIFILLLSLIILGAGALFVSPYYFYSKILTNDFYSEWYSLSKLSKKHLVPRAELTVSAKKLGNEDLWQKFHFIDVLIPLPVRNPFYYVSPVIMYLPKSKNTEVGLKIYDAKEREISKIYFMQNKLFPNEINGQKFFQLPLVKKHIKSYKQEKIWRDLFTKKLDSWNIPFAEMAYNLYLLHLRTKLLPDNFKTFSLVKDTQTAVIEMESNNLDYRTELILTKTRGLIYSYVLISEKENEESQLIRYKFLNETQFQGGSEYLSSIIYNEFKGLDYVKQIDHEGMLYLLSAWTHNTANDSYIKEMIIHLERGSRNQRQLESLYKYAYARYGETFSTKNIKGLIIDDNLRLQKNVEIEKKQTEERLRNQAIVIEEKVLTGEEEVQLMLRKAKRNKKSLKNRMIID